MTLKQDLNLNLFRKQTSEYSTLGELFLEDLFECYTLEDPVRETKLYGKTAIPAGVYPIRLTFSPRFKCVLPLLLNVPNFEGVRIHTGNIAEDTEGCILVGQTKGENVIGRSKAAFEALMIKLQAVEGNIKIDIK